MTCILVDSTADLSPELVKRYHLDVVPMYVNLNGKTYKDGVTIKTPDLFRFVAQTGQLPQTSGPTVPDFLKFFQQPEETVYIGLSSKLSSTLQNALLARQHCAPGRVYVIDSLNLSTGIGLMAIKAAEMRDQGMPAAEIHRQVSALVSKVRTTFIIETLDYIYKSGRCSALQNVMGGLLHIRPVISVREDGTLGVRARTRGSRAKALQYLLESFRENLNRIDLRRVFVTSTGCEGDAAMLMQELLNAAPIEEVLVTTAGSVVASHCGPDTIGILYLEK